MFASFIIFISGVLCYMIMSKVLRVKKGIKLIHDINFLCLAILFDSVRNYEMNLSSDLSPDFKQASIDSLKQRAISIFIKQTPKEWRTVVGFDSWEAAQEWYNLQRTERQK